MSVVIPVYNRGYCLAKSIESVFAQTFTDFEVIVVDDGSTDNSAAVARSFGQRVTLISQKNAGVSSAFNVGIRAARTRWIAFQASDDLWHPQKLERQMAVLEKNQGAWCATMSVGEKGESLAHFARPAGQPVEPDAFFCDSPSLVEKVGGPHAAMQSMVMETSLVAKTGPLLENICAAEDTEFIFRASLHAGMYFIDEPLTIICEGTSDSLTRSVDPTKRERRFDGYLHAHEIIHARLVELGSPRQKKVLQILGYYYLSRAELACVAGDFTLARQLARQAFAHGSMRERLRSAAIICSPTAAQKRLQSKWKGQWV